jgi:RNA polymerase sigma-70 factor (ECF subfamily)
MVAKLMAEAGDPMGSRPPLRLVRADAEAEVSPGARSDAALVGAFVAGDSEAFGTLVERYQRLVYSLVRRYGRTPEETQDLAQKAFVRAFAAAGRILPKLERQPETMFKAWLVRIAVNVGKNHVRDRRRWRMEPESTLVEVPAGGVGAPEALELAQKRRQVREAVLGLPKRQREVLTLRVDGDLPFAEVAATLGISENNAKVHFHHAVKRLRVLIGALEQEGG